MGEEEAIARVLDLMDGWIALLHNRILFRLLLYLMRFLFFIPEANFSSNPHSC